MANSSQPEHEADVRLRLSKWQGRTLRLLGTAALLVGIFWFIPFADVVSALREVDVRYVALGFTLMLLSSVLDSVQLWMLLRRVNIPIGAWRVFETKLITRFYGQFLPSELMASAVKLYRLAGPTKQWGEVVATMGFFRVLNMFVLVSLGVVFWAIEMPEGPGRWVGLILLGVAMAIACVHIVLTNEAIARHAKRIVPTRWLNDKILAKVSKIGTTMMVSYRLFGFSVWPVALLAVIRHAIGITSFICLAISLDIHLSILTVGWIRVVLSAIMMLPISFSGIGLREGSLVILLQEYAVPASDAVALAFLLFAITLIVNSLGGILELKNFLRPQPAEEPPQGEVR